MVQSIIACHQTLIELVRDPDSNQDYEEFDDRRNALNQIRVLIHSYKVNLYILPFSLFFIYALLRRRTNENFARGAIAELNILGNVNCNIDYGHAFNTAISLLHDLDDEHFHLDIPLYESIILPAAVDLKVSALVITEPDLLSNLIALCSYCPKFDIPILSVREAVEYLSMRECHSFSREDDILVRTPMGTIKKLRKGSTVIDFAYAVHTEIGSKCIGALVNHEDSPLDRVLTMNDMVEIRQSESIQTNESWLDFAKTKAAKKAINQSIRKTFQDKGWELINREFNIRSVRLQLDIIARNQGLTTNRLMEMIGRGKLTIEEISELLQKLVMEQIGDSSEANQENSYFIIGSNHQRWRQNLSNCCMPFPEDEAVGIVGINDGVIRIHRRDCVNIINVQSDKLIDAIWGCSCCSAEILLTMRDRPGALLKVLNYLAENGLTVDIRTVQTPNSKSAQTFKAPARSIITLPIRSRADMEQIIDALQSMPHISQVKVKQTQPIFDVIEE